MLTTEMVKTAQFLGAIALSGGAAFLLLVWWPTLQNTPRPAMRLVPDEFALRLAQVGAWLLVGAVPLDLLRLARLIANQPLFLSGIGFLGQVAIQTRYGQMLLVRLALGLVALVVARGKLTQARAGILLGIGLGAFASFSLSSHAAATPGSGPWPIIADLMHVGVVALWVGAMALLVSLPWEQLIRERRGQLLLYRVTRRIARLAIMAVVLLAASGVYLSSLRLYGLAAIPETSYGRTLAVKIILTVMILTLAAISRFRLLPRLLWAPPSAPKAARFLRYLVGAEVGLCLIALSYAADLTGLPAPQEPPYRLTVQLGAPTGLTVPLGRRVRLELVNDGKAPTTFAVRGLENRLFEGPGAQRHPEMYSYPPPTDRLGITVPAEGSVVLEFVPLAPGSFSIDDGLGILTVKDQSEMN